jgi:hypothetical protein
VNLVYRPIRTSPSRPATTPRSAFRTSARTSRRTVQTFANGIVDPCTTLNIAAVNDAATKTNRINNCTALAAAQGLTFDFAGLTPQNTDDFRPNYTSGIAGLSGGNPNLKPEESDSFTFSTVLRPRFIPNFSLVLDYYEIEINNIISAVSAPTAAALCVSGPGLGAACSSIFRNTAFSMPGAGATNTDRSAGFQIGGASVTQPGFIEGAVNFAGLQTRGLDFTAQLLVRHRRDDFGHELRSVRELLAARHLADRAEDLQQHRPSRRPSPRPLRVRFYPRVRLNSHPVLAADRMAERLSWTMDWQTAQDIVLRAASTSRPTTSTAA